MDRPANVGYPFFAYGIFRPGQLGFFQLKDLVSEITLSTVKGSLLLRDGLPIIDPNGEKPIEGALLCFASTKAAEEAYDRISAIEPDKHYLWSEAQAKEKEAEAKETTGNVLFGRYPNKGSVHCEQDEWDGWSDPLLTAALDVVEETVHTQTDFAWDLKPLFRLQMAYLLLWSAIERYVSLRYHLGDKVVKKISHLALEPAFGIGLVEHVSKTRRVYRADRPEDWEVLDRQSPEKALRYYYQIRSNITHRGKGAIRDHETLVRSLNELLAIFRGVLKAARADSQANT